MSDGTALAAMAFHEGLDSSHLDAQTAAVELINVLRAIVAIATFITFAAALASANSKKEHSWSLTYVAPITTHDSGTIQKSFGLSVFKTGTATCFI